MLRAHGLAKSFGGVRVLENVDLEIARGEVVGLAGPNGSGKSTLLEILSGYIEPDRGKVTVDGCRPTSGSELRARGVFRSYQMPRVFSRLSVADNLALGRWALPRRSAVSDCVEDLPNAFLAAGVLSVGQRRRVSLDWLVARLGFVQYFLLDEPTSGADGAFAASLASFLVQARKAGTGVLLVEHKPSLLKGLSDRVLELDGGRIRASEAEPEKPVASEGVVLQPHAGSGKSASPAVLEARKLTISRGGAIVVRDVSLSVSSGEMVVITGANGCGKSSFLLALYGDPQATVVSGSILASDEELKGEGPSSRIQKGIHFLPQERAVFDSFTVEETLRVCVEAVSETKWSLGLAADLRDKVPLLAKIWTRPCGTLSGGERRLVGLARLFALEPSVALLDEPLTGLDAAARKQAQVLLSRLASLGTALVVVEQQDLVSTLWPNRVIELS